MTDYKKYINALRKCAKEHEGDRTLTGQVITSNLCETVAELLEELELQPCDDLEYEKDLNELKERILEEGNTLVTKQDLLERFCKIDKEYNGRPWNLLQILANINILIGEEPCDQIKWERDMAIAQLNEL